MFYRPEDGHGLPRNPFSAIVSPRPIAWISTRGADGHDNLAPYSFFNAVAYTPPQVMFSSIGAKEDRDGTKDTLSQIRETGVFAINIAGYADRVALNQSSGPWPREVDEFQRQNVAKAPCKTIDCARVATAPATLECEVTRIIDLEGRANIATFGTVTGVHLREDCVVDGIFDITRFAPLTRLGYQDFGAIREVFRMERPDG